MSKFECSKFGIFEFVPTLAQTTNNGKILLPSMNTGCPWPLEGYHVSILAKKVYTNTFLNLNPILGLLDECFGQGV